jgi:uncharacterized protein YfiM (DUF2279 family)
MKTLILAALLLSGCSAAHMEQFGNNVAAIMAAKAASGSGYNYQQGMRDSQNFNNNAMLQAERQADQVRHSSDWMFAPGSSINPINVRIQQY